MKKTLLIPIALIILALLLSGCSSKSKPPLKDGMFLKYKHTFSGPPGKGEFFVTYKFKKMGGGKYKVIVEPTLLNIKGITMPVVQGGSAIVNDRLKTDKKEDLRIKMGQCPFWMPPDQLKEGAKFAEYKWKGTEKWHKWQVGVLEAKMIISEPKIYYDMKTGFFVGCEVSQMNGKLEMKLIETNVDGL